MHEHDLNHKVGHENAEIDRQITCVSADSTSDTQSLFSNNWPIAVGVIAGVVLLVIGVVAYMIRRRNNLGNSRQDRNDYAVSLLYQGAFRNLFMIAS